MPNRLAHESSPYLQQHAGNPVDWYPWGAEALAAARSTERPILLSVGYSACHWCHVMAHECFEDADTAALMNRHFVNIKVDREERPDIDQIYQTAHQLLTRRAGRLAAHDVPHARGQALLRRHLLPEARALQPAGLRRVAAAGGRRLGHAARAGDGAGRRTRSASCRHADPRGLQATTRMPATPLAHWPRLRSRPQRACARHRCIRSTQSTADSAARPSSRRRRPSTRCCATP